MTERTPRQFQTQAVVEVAEIIEASNEVAACHQCFGWLRQSTCATRQGTDALTKGGGEPFDTGCVDDAFALHGNDEPLNHVFRILYNSSFHRPDTFEAGFDHLHNREVLPGHHLASS
jgi:hypothetical protein